MTHRLLADGNTSNDFFFKYKFSDEPFGIGTLNKEQLSHGRFKKSMVITRNIPGWFDVGVYESSHIKDVWSDDRQLFYPKLVYLADEYLKNNKQFNNLMCVWYDKRNQYWEVHPGLGRKLVFLLFGPPEIKCFVLNNSDGKEHIDYDVIFNSNEELLEYTKKNIYIGIVPDMGSLIPDIQFEGDGFYNILDTIEPYKQKLQHFWQTHSLTHNMRLDVPINHNVDAKKSINITVKNNDPNSLAKAMILAPILNSDHYEDDEISIIIKEENSLKLPDLKRAVIEVYGGCNYACKMCPQTTGRGNSWTTKMPFYLFENILDQLPGFPIINLDGSGEALLLPDLPRYVKACADRGFKVFVYTNGSKLTGKYMRDIIDAGMSFIRVSCIGYDADKFQEMTGTDNFEKIRSNLLETQAYIKNSNSTCELSTYHLIMNEDDVKNEVIQYKKNFIDYAGVTGYIWKMHNWSGNYDPAYKRSADERITCGRPFAPEITIRAGGVNGAHGAVTPCCQTMGPPNEDLSVLGHADTESLCDIWYGEKYERVRQLHKEKRFDETPFCANCDFLYDDPEVLVWSNDPTASINHMLGTNFDLKDFK